MLITVVPDSPYKDCCCKHDTSLTLSFGNRSLKVDEGSSPRESINLSGLVYPVQSYLRRDVRIPAGGRKTVSFGGDPYQLTAFVADPSTPMLGRYVDPLLANGEYSVRYNLRVRVSSQDFTTDNTVRSLAVQVLATPQLPLGFLTLPSLSATVEASTQDNSTRVPVTLSSGDFSMEVMVLLTYQPDSEVLTASIESSRLGGVLRTDTNAVYQQGAATYSTFAPGDPVDYLFTCSLLFSQVTKFEPWTGILMYTSAGVGEVELLNPNSREISVQCLLAETTTGTADQPLLVLPDVPSPPTLDVSSGQLVASSSSGLPIEYTSGSEFAPYTGPIPKGTLNLQYGYYRFRIASTQTTPPSSVTLSPFFQAAP